MQYVALTTLLANLLYFAQASAPATPDMIAATQNAAIAAVNFQQGDVAALNRARSTFTADGWKDFMTHMQDVLDQSGAPTFTSIFVAARDAVLLGEQDGVVHLRIPGTLTQSSKLAKTTYKWAAIEVYAAARGPSGGTPVQIQRLQQITCPDASTPACR